MGGLLSKDEDEVLGLVLVPPLFERDIRGRSRMVKSAYDWQFAKPGLKWLFQDFMRSSPDDGFALFRFRPSEDPRLTVHARIGASLPRSRAPGANGYASRPKSALQDGSSWGRMALRFQPDVEEPLTFVDIKTGTGGLGATARACFFDVAHGAGAFAILPLTEGGPAEAALGLRYSSPSASVGAVMHPAGGRLAQAWAVGRSGPFCVGWQLRPQADLLNGGAPSLAASLEKALRASSYALSYCPDATSGRSNFETAVELRGQRQLCVSLLWHAAVQRLCKNPLEEENVVGITNYLNLGLQVVTDLTGAADGAAKERAAESHLRLGGSWQVNKNWLAKARVGSEGAAGALVLKAWWQPSLTFGLSAAWSFASRAPRLGFSLALENYGNIRYERSAAPVRVGKALVQRHVALPQDLANRDGQGLLVREKDLANKAILGQVQPGSARYL